MTILKDTRGQAMTLTIVFMVVLCGCTALVLDAGSWFRADRALQAEADAAALAGAHALPASTADAMALALDYAAKNGGSLKASGISFDAKTEANDTIKVDLTQPADGFFSKLFGLNVVSVHAKAAARSFGPNKAKWAAPIAVEIQHQYLSGTNCPCFGQATTLDLKKTGPGAFRLVNLDGSQGGTGPQILADWMLKGFDGYMDLGDYFSDPGAKFNSSHIQNALTQRIGSELLFPVYDKVSGQGANLYYHVVGWVGFHLTGFDAKGNNGLLYGHFTQVIWEGIEVSSNPPAPSFGVRSIQLID